MKLLILFNLAMPIVLFFKIEIYLNFTTVELYINVIIFF